MNQATGEALGLVTDEERAVAETLGRSGDGWAFLAARAMTRRVLGWVLGRSATSVEFCRSEHGRLALVDREVCFSVAYVRGQQLVAVSLDSEVGVDVQDDDVVYAENLHLALTEWEQRLLRRLSPSARHMFFLGLWTRKEAVLRAAGYGLRVPPDEVDVLVEDGAGTVAVPLPDGAGVTEVQVRDLPGARGTVAAAAAAGPVSVLHTWAFTPSFDPAYCR
ncbi:4'-phosphopantetheinyl transferase superfamily protein [Streptomyces lasiicapitis]|uniref:4'-phosphopantetheinyl transferase family protein n=1 Tax=Streptomyces TaxID=1883 RepID=UPI0013D8F000|nr:MULTISPECIES: 4'-phosphopantetheinyl transferase superfamily protein [Streptomyces]QIB47702.1 4'-phosphopantetheinyl transferase superfamily protein [Streptomyces aureoverticillatus]